ncbi:MAG: sensor histidine kinase [Oscillospiraceae bacterium]|nr:sensor histidine kinase [Oscillospiraceae bacterium]
MPKSLKFKIILSSAACVLTVGVLSNVYLYSYLAGIITEKADNIDILNLQTVQTRLNSGLEELSSLGSLCAYDLDVARGMRNERMQTVEQTRTVLRAQNALQRYLGAHSAVERYVTRLIAFNDSGVRAQAVARAFNKTSDVDRVTRSDVFKLLLKNGWQQIVMLAPSIGDGRASVVVLRRVYEIPAAVQRGWVYIEMDCAFISDTLSLYLPGSIFVADEGGNVVPAGFAGLPEAFEPEDLKNENTLTQDGRIYKIQSAPLLYAGLRLYSRADVTFLSADSNAILFTTVVIVLTSLTVSLVFAVLLGNIITKPLNRLTRQLKRLAENEFIRDPAIEKGGDEIADVGRTVNEMTDSINILLRETEEMHYRQKNDEIALLQSQVNPHFLYNTLDSIRWMAVIQKSAGIEKAVRSLSNLLKNLAKGVGDKITLEEELSLLKDYMDTQSVRFMELLEFKDCVPARLRDFLIVKFSLQPLVENAIFHGIVPKGECGGISVEAAEDGDYLLIFVEDNGIGMSPDEIAALFASPQNPHPKGMAGIGVSNVDERLKLVYGKECGLSYESEPGKFTRATVRIRKEARDV